MSRLFVALLVLVPTASLTHPRTDMTVARPSIAQRCHYGAGLATGGLSGRMPTMVTRCVTPRDVSLSQPARTTLRSATRFEHDGS